ncbi:hypothetical protein F5B22DRAFT_645993 [Xylaria bambusicola]|uniref:uncharacterized protein n=1 Tax=Xylaria bambusicola TaxID=326684 RepID=UPI0020082E41|nr:uncharacterized protein F5B22DRAFT_645993 [Xylaria bambusicola]KAI0517357.1 hypothetical protein F5B22DRAFT_645993 [Xylaria bambusicola]
MPPRGRRARLQADIQAASHETIPHVYGIGKGDAQDEFVFTFVHPEVPRGEVKLYAAPQDSTDYPVNHYFLVYANDEIPKDIRNVLDNAMTSTRGMLILDFLKTLSRLLCTTLEPTMKDEYSQPDGSDSSVGSDDELQFDFGDDVEFNDPGIIQTPISDIILQRIRRDFKAVRNAGFKVGKICGVDHISEESIAAMSIKVSKLCLSPETLMAWNLRSSDYLVLLMKYTGNYISFEDAMGKPTAQIPYQFKLRRCSRYRPTPAQAIAAFSLPSRKRGFEQYTQNPPNDENSTVSCGEFGIGGSIDLLLTDFIIIMKLRKRCNVSWDDAKRIRSELNSQSRDISSMNIPNPGLDPTSNPDTNMPPILMDDHLSSRGPISLPLVAMQFSLRYLVKCTDYCMICHEKLAVNFDALKPYVCGNPLCLFQYMNVGLGPSIDHEIINQEYVVDLLISFCYASLYGSERPQIREFPVGLNLQVPCVKGYLLQTSTGKVIRDFGILVDPRAVEISWPRSEVRFINEIHSYHPALNVGHWVIIRTRHDLRKVNTSLRDVQNPTARPDTGTLDIFHYARIENKFGSTLHLHIASRYPVPLRLSTYNYVREWNWDSLDCTSGDLVLCNQSLDELETPTEKALSLVLLLSALPSVTEMRSYLMADRSRRLATWDRIPLESMKLLRWIIASNRSFIVQLDNPADTGISSNDGETKRPDRSQERIPGVDGWIQFRFAQGSLEKEALFFDALDKVQKPNRTILAWHGSNIGNWHSIIREGLNFKVIKNGRAFGEGCYFSRSWDCSICYSGAGSIVPPNADIPIWPQSCLKITGAMSLNELVNLPEKFKHTKNCYVVDILHWIQCRYLFVRPLNSYESTSSNNEAASLDKRKTFKQDPQYAITGPGNKQLLIPEIAIPSVQRGQHRDPSSSDSNRVENDDTDEEDREDVDFLTFEDDVARHNVLSVDSRFPPTPDNQECQTDFRPGSLDFSQLPQLPLPPYATGAAQKIIQKELKKLEKIQSETPLHQLGWYIDFEKIENMFQWIVELHSFDPILPLAEDMKTAGVTSIVLEIRFLRGFPVTPPFVRVIKPRFLPFSMGGGGHVTSGGAMCMELLTNTGWSPANSMESVFLQVRLAMCSTGSKPARLEMQNGGNSQYSIGEAVSAAERAFRVHGWEIPPELRESIQS